MRALKIFAAALIFFSPCCLEAVQVPTEEYSKQISLVWKRMSFSESKHFELWTERRDEILAPYALETLEKAYDRIGAVLNNFPGDKIRVEIYRTKEDFSLASTLSDETLERSGAIGICKFKRLMILTPEQLAFGYRWKDTLAHELTHYLINEVSRENCPLWLHEGIAKYLETVWRLDHPEYLSPGNRTELVKAHKDDKLIPFSRMEPSMVYLNNQEEVRLAFSEVAHALHYIDTAFGRNAIRDILLSLGRGRTRDEAFQEVVKMDSKKFEESWKQYLTNENLTESPGAAPDKLTLGSDANEIDELASVDIQGHIRLGDRLRMNGKVEASAVQYQRAVEKEPFNPVALTKLARAQIALGKLREAETSLLTATGANPNYSPAFIVLGKLLVDNKQFAKAKDSFEEANAVNPFNPEIHESLVLIYESLGDAEGIKREKRALETLKN